MVCLQSVIFTVLFPSPRFITTPSSPTRFLSSYGGDGGDGGAKTPFYALGKYTNRRVTVIWYKQHSVLWFLFIFFLFLIAADLNGAYQRPTIDGSLRVFFRSDQITNPHL